MWVRIWFPGAGRPHQRAYTLVDPDTAEGAFAVEFALHEGPASRWARGAKPGDTLRATVQGSAFVVPDPLPGRMVLIGDRASVPALNSLLAALPEVPATVWLETRHDSDDGLPLRIRPARHEVRRLPREGGGARLAADVRDALPDLLGDPVDTYVWIACDTVTTRALARFARRELAVPKGRLHALGYWRP